MYRQAADPQLQVLVEGVVLHRALLGRVHLGVGAVDRAAEGGLLLVGAAGRHGQIGERGAGALDRVPVDATALDPALHHAVPDAGPGQLHDHVGRARQQADPQHPVVDGGSGAASAPARRGAASLTARSTWTWAHVTVIDITSDRRKCDNDCFLILPRAVDGCQDGTHGPGPSLPRRRRRPQRIAQRRRRLLDAGLDLLGGRADPSELTVRAICRQAGLAARYFYESFADKDDLVAAVFDWVIAEIAATTQAAVAAAPAGSRTARAWPTSCAPSPMTRGSAGCCSAPQLSNAVLARKRAEPGGVFALLSGQHVGDAAAPAAERPDQGRRALRGRRRRADDQRLAVRRCRLQPRTNWSTS